MKKYVTILMIALFLLFSVVFVINYTQNKTTPVSFTTPADTTLQWNRYTDKNSNFEILSIDDQKGKYLYENVDNIKSWIMTRWAFPNEPLSVKCKIVVVNTKDQFREFFGKDSPQYKIIKDQNGQTKEINIWLSTDDSHWNTGVLAKVFTEIGLQELEAKHGKVGLWVHNGMPILNGDLPTLRQSLGNLNLIFQNNLKVLWIKDILEMTPESLAKQPLEIAAWYDSESACFLLMLYKEFGARKFNTFLTQCNATNPEVALRTVYGFNTYADADTIFKKYMLNLSNDITGKGQKITPNSYLTWFLPR